MNDCPNYGHPDVPEPRPFNPFGEQEPEEPNDSNETGDQQGEKVQWTADYVRFKLAEIGKQEAQTIADAQNENVKDLLLSNSLLTEHYEGLLSTLKAVKAILSQPVQFSNGQGGSFSIIQGDCSSARDMITRTLSKEGVPR